MCVWWPALGFGILGYLEGLYIACSENPSEPSQFYACILFN